MSKKLIQAAAGAGGESVYVEDVFSTYLYTGTGSALDITNNIDLSGEGGLVWIKNRTNVSNHALFDTERGAEKLLFSDSSSAEQDRTADNDSLGAFNADGFSLQASSGNRTNESGSDFASWSFRKQAGFFDVVTTTLSTGTNVFTAASTGTVNGDGTVTIPHSLGSTPGSIWIKVYSGDTGLWRVFHRSATNNLILNETGAQVGNYFGNVGATSFDLIDNGFIGNNRSNLSFVIYLFAHDDQSFGDNSDESIIKCGSFTTDGNAEFYENLGFEPQWVLVKRSDNIGSWNILDNMRGIFSQNVTAGGKYLRPDNSNAEGSISGNSGEYINSTGFGGDGAGVTGSANATFIYIAIRRPMKTPEAGTDVFGVNSYSETTDNQQLTTGNLADWGWQFLNGDGAKFFTRLLGKGYLNPTSDAVANTSAATEWDYMDGFAPYYAGTVSGFSPRQVLGFTRASGFFDVVAWDGDGTSNRDINHNLGVTPELIIVKSRTNTDDWFVYLGSPFGSYEGDYMLLNSTGIPTSTNIANIFPSAPTSTTFRVGNERGLNGSGEKLIAYLLASVDGVSKIGTYNGSSSDVDITLGFAPRLFIVKKLDSGTSGTAHWIMWNSALGIVAGNDPRVRISSGAYYASNDCIDPITNGIRVLTGVNGNWNEAGSEYSYIAIA